MGEPVVYPVLIGAGPGRIVLDALGAPVVSPAGTLRPDGNMHGPDEHGAVADYLDHVRFTPGSWSGRGVGGHGPREFVRSGLRPSTIRNTDESRPGIPAGGFEPMSSDHWRHRPRLRAETTEGKIKFHDWIGDGWAVLFSHPAIHSRLLDRARLHGFDQARLRQAQHQDSRPLGRPGRQPRAMGRGHQGNPGSALNYPLISDTDFSISKAYGMLPADVSGDPTERTPAQNGTLRNVFVIGPDKKIKLVLIYPMTTGRNFDEVLRVLDSLQLTTEHKSRPPPSGTRATT